jgi:hypothetical protein
MARKRPAQAGGARKPRPKPASRPRASLSVRVRMYCQGLGDCFLLRFAAPRGKPFHVLIDCGVILGTKTAKDRMIEVACDIARETNKHLGVVVATHEHWDHLSGFIHAKEVFEDFTIDEVWFGWPEDPADELAGRLREGHRRTLHGLRALGQRLNDLRASRPKEDRMHTLAEHIEELLGFFNAASRAGTREAVSYLAGHKSKPRLRYHRPGGPPEPLPGLSGARVFVLGPPHDEKLLRRSNPTRTGKEVYEFANIALDTAFLAAASAHAMEEEQRFCELCQAFDAHLRRTPEEARQTTFFRESYWKPGNEWRRIDDDWLEAAGQLAINLDKDTNNTSLALAIELEPEGRVLLFPGDAQVGNWESWEQYSWPADGTRATPVTAADLLRRTVLYKVGHHASHNATLRAKGLELMDSPDLVAMIPVDQEMALEKRWLGMPFPGLLSRLREKARGRVLRSDAKEFPRKPDDVGTAVWDEFTRRAVVGQKLYIDYNL